MPNFNTNMFQRNAKKQVQKSFKDLSHEWKHDFSLGKLIPCLCFPTLPGDELDIDPQFFFQFDPLYYAIIHRVKLEVDVWWVRNANMWRANYEAPGDGWEKFITLSEEFEHPVVNVDMVDSFQINSQNDSVYGYCGVPYLRGDDDITRTTVITGLNAFVGMAYLQIYDQGYRHPQLEEARAPLSLSAGDNSSLLDPAFDYYGTSVPNRYSVFPAKWGKDYFTSLLPEPQVGDPVLIPMVADYDATGATEIGLPTTWRKLADGAVPGSGEPYLEDLTGKTKSFDDEPIGLDIQETAATVRDFWLASMFQKLKEQLMRWGTRYSDWLKDGHDEDIDPDMLGVPRLIGNWSGSVNVTTALTQANTSVGESDFFTGDYAGNMGLYENGNRISFKCKDYGVIMAIMSLTPNTGYGQGIPRWLRYSDPLDYPMDIFQGVGDQEILKEEVMYNNLTADLAKNRETFGYGVKFQEAFTIPNNYGSNLAFRLGLSTHLGKWYDPAEATGSTYDSLISLNRDFIDAGDEMPGGTRVADVFKVLTSTEGFTQEQPVIGYIYWKIGAMRPLAAYSTPGTGL